MTIDTIVVACMDRRLNEHIDGKYNDGHTIILRNAGANIGTLSASIKDIISGNDIKRIVVMPHTDCGAMKYTKKVLDGEIRAPEIVQFSLVSQFEGYGGRKLEAIEAGNIILQKDEATELVKGKGIVVVGAAVDPHRIQVSQEEHEHALVIARPSSAKYADIIAQINKSRGDRPEIGISSTYVIQAERITDVLPDIQIAIEALGIKDVRLFATADQKLQIGRDADLLRGQEFAKAAVVSLEVAPRRKAKIA